MQTLSFPWMHKKAPSRKTRCFFMLLSLLKGSPCPPSRSPPPRWGSGEGARYVTRCGGDGAARSKPSNLPKAAKKSRVRGENAANATKPHYFVALSSGQIKEALKPPCQLNKITVLCPVRSILETGTLLSEILYLDTTTRRPKRQPKVYASCGFFGNFCIKSRSAIA